MTDNREDVSLKAALHIFGNILRRKRQGSRWNFRELAEKSGVSEDVISQLETGEDVGTETERESLCDFLGLDPDSFAKVLRTHKAQVVTASTTSVAHEPATSNVVRLQGYRDKWPKTTTHPTD